MNEVTIHLLFDILVPILVLIRVPFLFLDLFPQLVRNNSDKNLS